MASHDAVAHNWAHDTGRVRRGFNLFWEGEGAGRTIYSYGHHFPIARFVEAADGGAVVLFTTENYSVSTSKHKTLARRAIPRGVPVFYVPDVMAETEDAHRHNHGSMVDEMRACLSKATAARKHGTHWLQQAQRWAGEANRYTAAFGFDVPPVEAEELDGAALERIREAKAEEKRREVARTREASERWKRGETDRAPHTSRPALRVRGDVLETSWGIRVPLSEALPVFRLALRCAAAGREFVPERRHSVGGWTLDRITARGDVVAGCHVLTMAEQQDAAERAGINIAGEQAVAA